MLTTWLSQKRLNCWNSPVLQPVSLLLIPYLLRIYFLCQNHASAIQLSLVWTHDPWKDSHPWPSTEHTGSCLPKPLSRKASFFPVPCLWFLVCWVRKPDMRLPEACIWNQEAERAYFRVTIITHVHSQVSHLVPSACQRYSNGLFSGAFRGLWKL